jgi:hypothetical protein
MGCTLEKGVPWGRSDECVAMFDLTAADLDQPSLGGGAIRFGRQGTWG